MCQLVRVYLKEVDFQIFTKIMYIVELNIRGTHEGSVLSVINVNGI
jgi:hypothetical protein